MRPEDLPRHFVNFNDILFLEFHKVADNFFAAAGALLRHFVDLCIGNFFAV